MAVDRLGRPLRDDPFRGNARVVATSNITLSGLQTIDGVTLESGDRVLAIGQTTASQNGIYVAKTGTWVRSRDLATADDFNGPIYVAVEEGTVGRNKTYSFLPSTAVTVDSTSISFTENTLFQLIDGDKGDITVSSNGTVWNIDAGAVGTSELATNAVTTAKITAGNVTEAKLSTSVQSVGADDTGATDCSTAFQSALDSGAKLVTARNGTFLIGTTLEVPSGVTLDLEGATLKPDGNVNVLRQHGGSRVVGWGTIDVTDEVGWNSAALLFDGNSEQDSGNEFRLYSGTYFELNFRGGTSGTGNGTAIKFVTTDDGVNNSWLMGVRGEAAGQGFDKAIWIDNNGTSGTRTFINSNVIDADWGGCLQTLVIDTEATSGYAVDGNTIRFKCQSRDTSGQTATPVVLAGQLNEIVALQWDWVGGGGGTIPLMTIAANARNSMITTWAASGMITNSSNDRSLVINNLADGRGISIGNIRPNTSDAILRLLGGSLRQDNNTHLYFRNSADSADMQILSVNSSDDTILRSGNNAGDNLIYNINNATGFHAFRHNGTNIIFVTSLGVSCGTDNTQALGTAGGRFASAYAVKFFPGAGTAQWTSGAGSPEGVLTAVVGSLYTDTSGGASTTLYVKETGTGNTGWRAV